MEKIIAAAIVIVSVVLCSAAGAFDLQGHRGARGLAPENTLPAFASALSIGVTTLEANARANSGTFSQSNRESGTAGSGGTLGVAASDGSCCAERQRRRGQ